MEYLTETRRYIKFKIKEPWQFREDGIIAESEELWFPKDIKNHRKEGKQIFETVEQCEAWYDKKVDVMRFDPQKKQYRTVPMVFKQQAKAVLKPTPDEWEKIQDVMTVPEIFTEDDVRVYHPLLAHNFKDRDRERFDLVTIKDFNTTIIDKSVLMGHSWGDPGVGRFFDSKLIKMTVEEALEFVGVYPDKKQLKSHLEMIYELEKGIYILNPSFYVMKSEEKLVRDLDAGIIRDMSIGFRANSREPIKDKDGNILWYEYQGGGEALEGSFVWLGAQPGARNRKQLDENPCANGNEVEPDKTEDSQITNNSGGKSMKLSINGKEVTFEADGLPEVQKEIDSVVTEEQSKTATIQSELDTTKNSLADVEGKLTTANEELESYKTAFGDYTPEKAKELIQNAANGKAYIDLLINEIIQFKSLLGLLEKDEESVKGEKSILEILTLEQLKTQHDQLKKAISEKFPYYGQLNIDHEFTKHEKTFAPEGAFELD